MNSSGSSLARETSRADQSEVAVPFEVGLEPPVEGAGDALDDPLAVPAADRARIRVLIVDDERTLRDACASVLQVEGYTVAAASRGDEALEMMRRSRFDIVLLDLYMKQISGLELLKSILAIAPRTIVLIMTGKPSVSSSVEALRLGAWDYLPKPFSGSHLQILLGRAAHAVLDRREREQAMGDLVSRNGNSDRITLLGKSPAFRRVVELARKVASTSASVMLVGESGTGKEMIAQFIHYHSLRAKHRLVPLNCAAVPEHLLESELFGHRKGAFTGADREKIGLLEMANEGTFFFDEITEMPLSLQAKLLRVVQDGVLRRVGSEQQDARVDVRFISATNFDPREAIRNRQLREDLYYRLNVCPIHLPPLRERVEDIPVLAQHFLEQFWRRHHPLTRGLPYYSESALEFLQSRPWRGNVRELQNVIEHLVVVATPSAAIQPEDIPIEPDFDRGADRDGASSVVFADAYHVAKEQVLANFEKEYVTRVVARASGNMSRAARLASMDRTTLYRLMERHGLGRDGADRQLA